MSRDGITAIEAKIAELHPNDSVQVLNFLEKIDRLPPQIANRLRDRVADAVGASTSQIILTDDER